MFGFLNKKKANNNEVVAVVDGKMIDITKVKDPMFAQKMMGDGVAFEVDEDEVTVCSPCSGFMKVLFSTGHAFGVQMENGVEILIHIGVDTVEANGDGFSVLHVRQNDQVKQGQPIVKVNMKKLKEHYDVPIMMVFTNTNGHDLTMPYEKTVTSKEVIMTIND